MDGDSNAARTAVPDPRDVLAVIRVAAVDGMFSFECKDFDGLMAGAEGSSFDVSEPRRLFAGRNSRDARLAKAEAVIAVTVEVVAVRRDGGSMEEVSLRADGFSDKRLGS